VSRPGWSAILTQVFGVSSQLVGFVPIGSQISNGVKTALAIGTAAMNLAGNHTNSADGKVLKAQENEEDEAGKLAGDAADEFSQTLVTLGNEFDRSVSDWGRLKTLGGPLLADQVPWDATASGLLLRGYDRLVRRNLYTNLIKANAEVTYYSYTSDESFNHDTYDTDHVCFWSQYQIDPYWQQGTRPNLFYPSGAPNTDTNPGNRCCDYPHDYDWAIWALVFTNNNGESCAVDSAQPSPFGLFDPLDLNNPDALGSYRLWFFTREGYVTNPNHNEQPCYDGAGC
jgi:hypothetical protein